MKKRQSPFADLISMCGVDFPEIIDHKPFS